MIFLLCLPWVQLWDIWQQCSARGGNIWLHLTGIFCPWEGNVTATFWKMSNPHPMPGLPPPPPCRLLIDRCITFPFESHELFGSVLSYDNMRDFFFWHAQEVKGCDFSWKKKSQNFAWLVQRKICLIFKQLIMTKLTMKIILKEGKGIQINFKHCIIKHNQ